MTTPFLPIAEARANNLQPLTVPELRRRSPAWTEGTVAKLLGPPDAVMHNPNGGKMRVYFTERVKAAEATPAFAAKAAKVGGPTPAQ